MLEAKWCVTRACLCAAIRLVTSVLWLHTKDLTYYFSIEGFLVYVHSLNSTKKSAVITKSIYRGAEIVFGLTCSFLPVLPQFFLHCYPKITSKVFSWSTRTKDRHASTILSNPCYKSRPRTPWLGQSVDVPLTDSSYRELDNMSDGGRTKGRSIIIEGGYNHSRLRQDGEILAPDPFRDLEIAPPTNAIRKTVRVEMILEK